MHCIAALMILNFPWIKSKGINEPSRSFPQLVLDKENTPGYRTETQAMLFMISIFTASVEF